uniref:Uncharacterized protein n=1 Tax=Nelumbo nucifera TaxID=4432 RepID=A0A822XTG6_NELNU|nr:TPA_asm: hypothetical protein HUJ06_023924 [Nelumbo nucifera]
MQTDLKFTAWLLVRTWWVFFSLGSYIRAGRKINRVA